MIPQDPPARWQLGLGLMVGVLAVSTGAILVRLAMAAANTQGLGFSLVMAASRMAIAALLLLPNWPTLHRTSPQRSTLGWAIAAGCCLALHFVAWITSLSYTSIAASTTLVTTNPIWVALFSWLGWRERPSPVSLGGISLALVGSAVIGLGDVSLGGQAHDSWLGDGLALVGAWMISLYFLLGREAQRLGLSLSGYVAIAYTTAALVLLPLPWLAGTPYTGYPAWVYGYLALMALLPQLIGHTSFNWAIRWLSPTLVTLAILLEPVVSSLLGYWVFGELPGSTVGLGAVVVLSGVAIATLGNRKIPSRPA